MTPAVTAACLRAARETSRSNPYGPLEVHSFIVTRWMQQDVILLKFKLSPWFDVYSLSSFGGLPGGLAWLGTDISGPTLKMGRTVGP